MWIFPGPVLRIAIEQPKGAGELKINAPPVVELFDAWQKESIQRFSFDGFRRDPVADDDSNYGGAERTVVNASVGIPVGGGELRFIANGLRLTGGVPLSLSS